MGRPSSLPLAGDSSQIFGSKLTIGAQGEQALSPLPIREQQKRDLALGSVFEDSHADPVSPRVIEEHQHGCLVVGNHHHPLFRRGSAYVVREHETLGGQRFGREQVGELLGGAQQAVP